MYDSGGNCTENECASQIMQNSFLIMLCDFPDIRHVFPVVMYTVFCLGFSNSTKKMSLMC